MTKDLYGSPWTEEDLAKAQAEHPPKVKVVSRKPEIFGKGPDFVDRKIIDYDVNIVPQDYCSGASMFNKKIKGFC